MRTVIGVRTVTDDALARVVASRVAAALLEGLKQPGVNFKHCLAALGLIFADGAREAGLSKEAALAIVGRLYDETVKKHEATS